MTNISKVNYLLNIIIIMDHFDDDFAILCNGTSAILSNRTCKCVDFYSFFLDLYIVIFSSGVFFLKSIVSCLFISILVNKFRKTHVSSFSFLCPRDRRSGGMSVILSFCNSVILSSSLKL